MGLRLWLALGIALLLGLVCFTTHFFLISVGLAHLNSDAAIYPLTAEWIARGHFVPFQINYQFGGVALTMLRIPWVWLNEWLGSRPDSFLMAHFSFSYCVVPFMLSLSFYFMARAYSSVAAALVVGVVSAVGFQSWIVMGHVEFYNAYLILGAILLGIRGRFDNPFKDMSAWGWFGVNILCGLAFYTCRASIVFLIPFYVSAGWAFREIKQLFKPVGRVEVWLHRIIMFLLFLFIWLEVFGPDLGIILGRTIKLHAHPNLYFACALLVAVWLSRNIALFDKAVCRRILLAVVGFGTGMAPEIYYWIVRQGRLPPLTGGGTYSFQDSMSVIGKIPHAFGDLVSSSPYLSKNASLLLFVGVIVIAISLAKKERNKLSPVLFCGALAVFSYARVFTYDFAPSRYLLPIFPALMVALGVCVDFALKQRRKYVLAVVVGLVLVHVADQIYLRREMFQTLKGSGNDKWISNVVGRFKREKVPVVLVNNYWITNQFSVASRLDPIFIQPVFAFHLPESADLVRQAPKIGLMQTGKGNWSDGAAIEAYGKKWKLKFLERIGEVDLLVGFAQLEPAATK